MQPLPLTPSAHRLVQQLTSADRHTGHTGQTYHVASLGSGFYFAYEQLRNVAEYREHHLLLRSAIGRYLLHYVRLDKIEPAAADMVTELTQAGYLKNDSVPTAILADVDNTLADYSVLYETIRHGHHVTAGTASTWLNQMASVQIEEMLAPDPQGAVVMQFAYEHYYHAVDRAEAGRQISDQRYRIALFCAVQRAIFKSDPATTRYYCVAASLPNLASQPAEHVIELNKLMDELYQAPVTNKLMRLVNRYGAPIRILRELIIEGNKPEQTLANRDETLSKARAIAAQLYIDTKKSLNSRLVKIIMFILITKTLLGVALEVPYDLVVSGVISWTPLLINIMFPVIYMAIIGTRIAMPSRQNTEVISGYIDRILYEGAGAPVVYKTKRRITSRSLNSMFSLVYVIGFFGSFALLVWLLRQTGFNLVNGFIFFLFFSAVSFLGFRLRQSAHELALLDERQGLIQTLADFLSTPFVRVGHWLSDKYAKANIVTLVLDVAIEMPLKTSLRLVRQWISFMRDKQEEL